MKKLISSLICLLSLSVLAETKTYKTNVQLGPDKSIDLIISIDEQDNISLTIDDKTFKAKYGTVSEENEFSIQSVQNDNIHMILAGARLKDTVIGVNEIPDDFKYNCLTKDFKTNSYYSVLDANEQPLFGACFQLDGIK